MQPKVYTDTIQNFENYTHLNPKFSAVNDFLQLNDLTTLPEGRGNIDSTVFYIVSTGAGKSQQEAKLETHQKYIDVQVVINGIETYGWKALEQCDDVAEPYDAEKDIVFFNNTPEKWFTSQPGSFILFFPQDAHAPMVGEGEIRKVVIKVPVQ